MKFLFKRVMIFCAILVVASVFFVGGHPLLPLGILVGGLFSVYKIRMYKTILTELTRNNKPPIIKLLVILTVILVLSFAILFVAIKIDIWFFFGIAAGLVSTAAVICITVLAEKTGLMRNDWWNT